MPDVPGLLIHRISQFGVNGSERIGGVSYTVQTHEYAVFAQRAGRFEIPPIRLRFAVAGGAVGDSEPMDLMTEPVVLVASMPPGAEGLVTLLTTTELSLTEKWEPDPGPEAEFEAGDAVRRIVIFRAPDVMGLAFPPLRPAPIDGVGIYPEPPLLNDRTERGEFTGERTDGVTFVFERPGTFTIPGISVDWWDPRAERLRRSILPERTFVVVGSNAVERSEDQATSQSEVWEIMAVVAFLVLCVLIAMIRPVRLRLALIRQSWQASRGERLAFRNLISVSLGGESAVIYRSLRSWLQLVKPGGNLFGLLRAKADPDLLRAVQSLEKSVLSGEPGAWDGSRLEPGLRRWRRALKAELTGSRPAGLPGLNP